MPGAVLHQQQAFRQALPAHGTQAACDAVRGFRGSPQGSFAGYHLTFLLTPCPQDSRGRKVPAVPVLGQHLLVIAWINIDGCHGRGCLLGLPGRGTCDSGGGRNGRFGEK